MAASSLAMTDAALNAVLQEATPNRFAGTAPMEGDSDADTDAAQRVSQESVGGQPVVSREMRGPKVTRLSPARASLIALYDFFEPALTRQGYFIPENRRGKAPGEALVAYGVAPNTS